MSISTCFFNSAVTLKPITFSKPLTSLFLINTISVPCYSSSKRLHFGTLTSSRVAVSSEYGQQQYNREHNNFSPELKLFVGNLPFNVDSSQLAGLFSNAGTVEMVEVIYDKMTGRSRGFGFVTMSSPEEVEVAAQQFNGYELDGRPLRVNAGPPPPKREDDFSPRGGGGSGGGRSFENANRIHVSNLSWQVDDSSLKTLFSESGDVVEAKVIYDRDSGRSRGFGFVTYGSADEVHSAIESMDGLDFNGRNIRVTVAESKPRRF